MLQTGDHIDIWVVERALGQGGMGSVYRCHNRSALRILAAIKVLDPSLSKVSTAKARFVREAEILFALDHPNIVKVRNVRMDSEMPYLEMEFIDGQSLEGVVQRGPTPARDALAILVQAADALAYMHGLGIRHRDIKPSNLLLQGERHLKLVDFGIATEQEGQSITESGQAFGSVSYAPPEWIDPKRLDPVKWDIYSLGVVFFELLTGRLAFPMERDGTSRQRALQVMIAKQDHPTLDPGHSFPDGLRQLVAKMAHPDPAQRLDSASEVKRRLEQLINELGGDEPIEDARREYEILETLGTGGFGTVYRARYLGESGFSKEVALKVLHPEMAQRKEIAQRLRDEARMLGLLRHRSVVQVDRLTRLGGRWALVMEYVRGADLKQVIEASGPLPSACALEIAAEVAGALHMAYASPGPGGQPLKLVHRDIKPPNIQLTPFGEVKILDFGIARAEFANREAHTQKLSFGSVGYMAPERLDMTEGPAGDVYSLGAVLYEMLTGEAIGRTAASERRHTKIMKPVQEALAALVGVPEELTALIAEMLAYEPEGRPSAREVERRCLGIRRGLSGEPMRYWTEEVVTPILAERAKLAESSQQRPTGELSGAVLREPDEDGRAGASDFDPDLTLPDGPAPDPDGTFAHDEGGGDTWYPGVIEDIPQASSPTMVPDAAQAEALERTLGVGPGVVASLHPARPLPATPPPEAPAQRAPAEPVPPVAAPLPIKSAPPPAPDRSEPEPPLEPPPSKRRGLLFAVAALTLALIAVLAWWQTRPPPAPETRDASLVLTGLPSGSPVAAWMRGADGQLVEGEPDGPHAFVFPQLSPGAWTAIAVQGPEGCSPVEPPPSCGVSEQAAAIEVGQGAQSLRMALTEPTPRAITVKAPALAEREDLSAELNLRGPLLEPLDAPPPASPALPIERSVPVSAGEAKVEGLPPGAYVLQLVVTGCPEAAEGEAPTCPPQLMWVTLERGDDSPPEPAFELALPPRAKEAIKPPPSAPEVPKEAAASGPSRPVTVGQFARWLGGHPEWLRDAAVADGRADGGYLKGWDGATPPGGSSAAMVNVSWAAAEAYCAGRGGLAAADAAPLTWEETAANPWHEYRQSGGRPAWRRKEGAESTSVKRSESSPVHGFRCAR